MTYLYMQTDCSILSPLNPIENLFGMPLRRRCIITSPLELLAFLYQEWHEAGLDNNAKKQFLKNGYICLP